MGTRIFTATKEGQCNLCHSKITLGEHISWPRRGENHYRVHAHCGKACECEEGSEGVASTSSTTGNGNAQAAIGALIGTLLEPLIAEKTLSADAIRDIVQEEIGVAFEQLEPPVTTIAVQAPNGETRNIGTAHKLFPRLLALVSQRTDSYLYGAPGGGKSTAAKQCADGLGLDYAYIALNVQTTDSRLLGYMDANGSYRSTPFRKLYETGGIFCIDELDNATANLLTTLNGALANGHCAFPDGIVERHRDFCLIGTGNTAGRGASRQHADRRQFDAAFADRLFFLKWEYDEDLELNAAKSYYSKADLWVRWIQQVRAYCADQSMFHVQASPRASIQGARLMAAGLDNWRELSDGLVFKGLEASQVSSILSACSF